MSQDSSKNSPILLRATGSKRSKPRHKEMKTREGNHVNCKLPEISVQLTRESKAGGHT